MSSNELIKMYQTPSKPLESFGDKKLFPENTPDEKNHTLQCLLTLKSYLEQIRVTRRSNRCQAIWLPDKRISKVIKQVGQVHPQFGFIKDKSLYFTAEESLFLTEINKLELLWNEIPFSIEQAFAVITDTENRLSKYRMFKELAISSFNVKDVGLVTEDTKSFEESPAKKAKVDNKNVCSEEIFEKLKKEGPQTFNLKSNKFRTLYNISIPQKEKKKTEYNIIQLPKTNLFTNEVVSQNDESVLAPINSMDSVTFFQFHKVDLEN